MDLQRRHVQLKGSSNLRDIGGYPARDGLQVRWGRVFRSGALWGLHAEDWQWIDDRGVAVICDLRSTAEREIAPTRWQGRGRPLHVDESYDGAALFGGLRAERNAGLGAIEGEFYIKFARLLAPSLRGLFKVLQDGAGPVIVHCTAGQDRTGLAVALLLAALGVDRATIHADYLLSTELRRPEYELDREGLAAVAQKNVVAAFYAHLIDQHGPDAFTPKRLVDAEGVPLVEIALTAIEREWGGIEPYLDRELGIGSDELVNLRRHLLEPA